MKVLYIVIIPSPYMVNYFNELGKYCDLTVIFEKDRLVKRDKSWQDYKCENFNAIYLKENSKEDENWFFPQVLKYLKKGDFDFIFISNMATYTGIMAINYLKLKKTPYFLESEGGFAKDGKGFKEKFKRFLMKGAETYFSTTKVGDEYFIAYGATPEKIVKYPFTSIYEKDILEAPPTKEEKRVLREKLGIKEEKVVISVGRFIPIKGYDILLDSGKFISKNTGVYIIGGEPTEEYLQKKTELNLNNFHFVGFCDKEALSEYYKAADLFVLPTRRDTWGLVINEAMAYGLPIVTTEFCVAGLELVDEGKNGYIVPIENSEVLAEKINYILNDNDLTQKMSYYSSKKIKWYTVENMAKIHIDFLKEIEENKR